MMVRTPPPKRPRADSRPPEIEIEIETSPQASDRPLVIYEDPNTPAHLPDSSHDHSDPMLLCTYQCRQLVKSQLLDNYATMEKALADYQLKLDTLNSNLLKAEMESKKYGDQLLYAEQELSAARGREQALQLKELKDISDSEERLKKQIQECHELKVNLQKEVSMRKTVESKCASVEEKVHLLEEKLKHMSGTAEREKRSLQDEIKHLKEDSKLSISKLRADLDRMECRACSAERESRLLNEKLEEARDQLKKCLLEKAELEKKLTSFTIPKEDATSQNDILVKHLQEQLRTYESEIHEARKLKASHETIELLKEKLVEEKGRRERAETELLKLQEVQNSTKMVEDELSSWKKVMEDIPGISSSDDIRLKFAALQKEVINSMEKMSVANSRLKQLEVALATVELDMKSAKTEAALAKEKEEFLKSEVKTLNSRLSSVIEERDHLRTTIDHLKMQKSVEPGGASATEFESTLAQKEGYIKELENHLCEQKAASERHCNEIRMLNEKLNNEERRIKSLEREGDRLRAEIALLESKLGHGDFSAANTKVLRMVNALGVDDEARQTIEALQNELQKAYEKLKVVEELKKESADAGKLVDSYISGEILKLKEHIATLEKREERYKTVFADRISVFRRACCELFGYKIVMDDRQRSDGIPVTRFTLQSIYAQSDEEKLEFEYESGSTKILVNSYTKQPDISQQVEIFVRKMNSIPAFTANLTVESFNRRTLS